MAEASAQKKAPESKKSEESKKEKPNLSVVPETGATAPAKPKRDLLTISILVVSILNVAMLVTLGLVVNKMSNKVKEVQEKTTAIIEAANNEEKEREEAREKKKNMEARLLGKEIGSPTQGTLYPLDSFLVNITSEQGSKFLQTQLEVELGDPALEEEVTKKRAAIRDAIIVLLSSKSYQELREPVGIKNLRTEVQKVLNGLLTTGKIKGVFFTQFHFN